MIYKNVYVNDPQTCNCATRFSRSVPNCVLRVRQVRDAENVARFISPNVESREAIIIDESDGRSSTINYYAFYAMNTVIFSKRFSIYYTPKERLKKKN